MWIKTEKYFGISFEGVTMDEAGQCQRANFFLALRFPNIYCGKCYARQVNLIAKDILKVIYIQLKVCARDLVKNTTKAQANG